MLHYHTDKKFDRTDPTGTARVRRNFRGQARLRWQRISMLTKDMLVDKDMLALKGGGLSTIHQPAIQGGATKIDIFQRWFDLTLNTILLNLDGDFMKPLLDEAYAMGETFGQDRMQTTNRNPMAAQRLLTLQKLAFIEMQGIIEAASQQSVRAVANGLLHNRTPSQISVVIRGILRKIGVIRSNALADMLVVKSFNEAALDVYEAAGLTHVGVLAEMRARFMAVDAGPGSRISRTKAPSTRTVQRIRKAARELERRLGRSVAIRTAGDDDVCPICEDIEEDGPYPIDTARSLIPAHPHCRCAFVPVMDRRYAETDDSYNPSQPRDPAGTSTGGQWTGGEELTEKSGPSIKMKGEFVEGSGRRRPESAHEIQLVGPDGEVHYRAEILEERSTAEKLRASYPDLFHGTIFGVGYIENLSRRYKGLGERMYKTAAQYAERHGGTLVGGGNLVGEHSEKTLAKLVKSGHAKTFEAFGRTLYRITSKGEKKL